MLVIYLVIYEASSALLSTFYPPRVSRKFRNHYGNIKCRCCNITFTDVLITLLIILLLAKKISSTGYIYFKCLQSAFPQLCCVKFSFMLVNFQGCIPKKLKWMFLWTHCTCSKRNNRVSNLH